MVQEKERVLHCLHNVSYDTKSLAHLVISLSKVSKQMLNDGVQDIQ